MIENGNVYLAQPPLFKINKGAKGIYIKDEKELEEYIINNSKELKKTKKGSKDFLKLIEDEKSKMNIQRFKGLGEMNPGNYGAPHLILKLELYYKFNIQKI